MNILDNIYQRSLIENEKNLRFWEDYLQRLTALDFTVFTDKLKVPVLVPVGNRVLLRGEIQHTNEITVSLGADYFTKCSVKQAEVLRQHRIQDAKSKVESFKKEREYLENQLSFGKKSVFEDQGQDIIEHYTEEEDKAWREKHKENMRVYKQNKKANEDNETDFAEDELWNRLEELELQEELQNELQSLAEDSQSLDDSPHNLPFILAEEEETNTGPDKNETEDKLEGKIKTTVKKKVTFTDVEEDRSAQISSKLDLLQKVLQKQHEIEKQLQELKAKERGQSQTENELIKKLDEIEQLEDLEDEMDRLEDVLENEDIESNSNDDSSEVDKDKGEQSRGISFADDLDSDDDEPQTIEINFKHSDYQPNLEPYDSNKGIEKPSDMYAACSHLFKETRSILKKSKYGPDISIEENRRGPINMEHNVILEEAEDSEDNETIVVKDVCENVDQSRQVILEESRARPTSLFKLKRQQQKKRDFSQ